MLDTGLKKLGDYEALKNVIQSNGIEEVIIATEPKEHEKINNIINDVADLNVSIKVIADMYNILTGSVKMSSIFGALLISVNPEILSPWEKITKRIVDVLLSAPVPTRDFPLSLNFLYFSPELFKMVLTSACAITGNVLA